jgi:hypothetical protein
LFCKWIASQSTLAALSSTYTCAHPRSLLYQYQVKYKERKYKDRERKSKNTAVEQPHRERRFGLGTPYAEQIEIAWMYSPVNVRQMMCMALGKVFVLLPKIITIILLGQYKDIEDQWESGFPRSMRKQDQATGAACTLPNSTKHPTKEKFSTSTPAQSGRLHQIFVVLPSSGKVMTHMELDRGYGGF